jgi:hypothetical protein
VCAGDDAASSCYRRSRWLAGACVCVRARARVRPCECLSRHGINLLYSTPTSLCTHSTLHSHHAKKKKVAYTRPPAVEPHTYRSYPSRTHGKQLPVSKRGTLISHTVVIGVLLRLTRTIRRSAAQCFSTPTQVRPIYMLSDPKTILQFVWENIVDFCRVCFGLFFFQDRYEC